MEWLIVAIIVFVIYNAERLPEIMEKIKKDVPHIVESGKKVSSELKRKAQNAKKENSETKNVLTDKQK